MYTLHIESFKQWCQNLTDRWKQYFTHLSGKWRFPWNTIFLTTCHLTTSKGKSVSTCSKWLYLDEMEKSGCQSLLLTVLHCLRDLFPRALSLCSLIQMGTRSHTTHFKSSGCCTNTRNDKNSWMRIEKTELQKDSQEKIMPIITPHQVNPC